MTHYYLHFVRIGYAFAEDDRIDIKEAASMVERIAIDKELLRAGVRLSPEYISRTYGVTLEGYAS